MTEKAKSKRTPAVAGMFYPDSPVELTLLIERLFLHHFGPGKLPPKLCASTRKIYGIISPHAGYDYSGAVAANGFFEVSAMNFDSVVMVGPNHYGIGSAVATVHDGMWETPLGEIEVDSKLTMEISKKSHKLVFDDFAHSRDHCLEVQIPFIQFLKKDAKFRMAPIVMWKQDIETAMNIGHAISDACSTNTSTNTLLIASSDFTHYEPNDDAHRKDGELVKTILSLDVSRFYSVLQRLDISACGFGPIASVMTAAKDLGATKGELLRYATSGDVTGDMGSVVGYSSIIFV